MPSLERCASTATRRSDVFAAVFLRPAWLACPEAASFFEAKSPAADCFDASLIAEEKKPFRPFEETANNL